MKEFREHLENLLLKLKEEHKTRINTPYQGNIDGSCSEETSQAIEDFQTIKHMILSTEEFLRLLNRNKP